MQSLSAGSAQMFLNAWMYSLVYCNRPPQQRQANSVRCSSLQQMAEDKAKLSTGEYQARRKCSRYIQSFSGCVPTRRVISR